MARLVIAGAGGLGREMLDWVNSSPLWRARFGIDDLVYLTDTPPARPVYAEVISSIFDYRPTENDRLIVAIGDPAGRRTVVERLTRAEASIIAFWHDSAVISAEVGLPDGTIVCPGVVIGSGASLGGHVLVNATSYIGHDATIGEFSTISPGCSLGGGVTIGSDCMIGLGVTLRPHSQVGSGSTIGAGSTVVASIPAGTIAYGTPAVAR